MSHTPTIIEHNENQNLPADIHHPSYRDKNGRTVLENALSQCFKSGVFIGTAFGLFACMLATWQALNIYFSQ